MENCLYLFRPEDDSDEHLIPRYGISQHEWQKYIKTDSELKTDDNNHNAVIFCGEKFIGKMVKFLILMHVFVAEMVVNI